jgi:hypothetical protein
LPDHFRAALNRQESGDCGRFPVTLYKEQWLRILASAPEIEAFIRENDSRLKTKE